MPRIDFSSPEFHYDATDAEGFRNGMLRFGDRVGAKTSGCSLYELPPGQAVCPYHYEYGEEEWLLVVSGRPTLRTPEGEAEIGPNEIVFFPTGPAGAHLVRNTTDSTVLVLMFSTRTHPSVAVYPDSDKVGVFTGNKDDDVIVRKASRVDYFDGEADRPPAV
jgi:uncharacterized cupin superfamily protein